MTLSELAKDDVGNALRGEGLVLQVGPFAVRVRSPFPALRDYLCSHYGAFPVVETPGAHFSMAVEPPSLLRRVVRPQAWFSVNGHRPFTRVPVGLTPGMFEWGFNWSVGTLANQWLVVHSAVVERGGRAALLPAPPGSGKSTLCAALAFSGWRLFSDEFALVDPVSGELVALPRPISLKGPSIDLMASRVPGLRLGPLLSDTDGATARHVAPPSAAVARQGQRARAAWLVVPKWEYDAPLQLETTGRARMLAHLADSSFNYNVLGGAGFARLAEIVDGSRCCKLTYSNLDEALALFDRLAGEREPAAEVAR